MKIGLTNNSQIPNSDKSAIGIAMLETCNESKNKLNAHKRANTLAGQAERIKACC